MAAYVPPSERSDTFALDGAWQQHYDEEGYVIIKDLLPAATLAEAQAGCEVLVEEFAERLVAKGSLASQKTCKESAFDRRLMDMTKECPGELPNLFRAELHRKEFFPLFCDPTLLSCVQKLLPADTIRIYPNYSCRPKTPSEVHAVVWHQDAGLRSDGGPSTAPVAERLEAFGIGKVVNVWTPLVPARVANGCMKVVPKSHSLGILEHKLKATYSMGSGGLDGKEIPKTIDGFDASQDTKVPVGTYMTAINDEDMAKVEHLAVDVELDPGSVLLFNNILVHRGGVNSADTIRWSFDFRFQDASKSTCRDWNGHIVKGPPDAQNVVRSADEWAKLSLAS